MTSKEKRIPWTEYVEKTDPGYRSRPVVSYVFDDGKRVFYKGKRKAGGTRKS